MFQSPFTRPFRPSSTAAPSSLYATPVSMCNVWPTNLSLPPFSHPCLLSLCTLSPIIRRGHATLSSVPCVPTLTCQAHKATGICWCERNADGQSLVVARGHNRCTMQRHDCANCVVRRGGHVSTEAAHSSTSDLVPCCRRCLLGLQATALRLVCLPVCFAALRAAVGHRAAAAAAP